MDEVDPPAYRKMRVTNLVSRNIKSYYSRVRNFLTSDEFLSSTWNVCLFVTLILIASVFAIFTYGMFYYMYVPQTSFTKQAHFRRTPIVVERPSNDEPKTNVANVVVDVLQAKVPLSDDPSNRLLSGMMYNLAIELQMPDSDVNHEAGTFMLSASFLNKVGVPLKTDGRLVMLKYRSWLLRIMDTFFYAPFYLIGFLDQSQTRYVPHLKGFVESSFDPAITLAVTIDKHNLQVYSATVLFEAELDGMRYYMHHWRIITALTWISLLWVIYTIIVSASWYALTSFRTKRNIGPHGRYERVLKEPPKLEQEMDAMMAPNALAAGLGPVEHKAEDVDDHSAVTSLGVIPLDSSHMTNGVPIIRQRRNHTDEQ